MYQELDISNKNSTSSNEGDVYLNYTIVRKFEYIERPLTLISVESLENNFWLIVFSLF